MLDVSCAAQLSINCSYSGGEIDAFKLNFGILCFPFVWKDLQTNYIKGSCSYFFKYVFFYILIISNFFRQNKLFILFLVSLYKILCQNIIVRECIFLFSANYSAVVPMFYSTLKIEEMSNPTIFVLFSVM